MRPGPVLALLAGPAGPETAALEFLRLVAGLVAYGQTVRLAVLDGAGWEAEGEARHDEVERHLEALRACGVMPERLRENELAAAIRAASSVVRYGDPARLGEPALLRVDAATDALRLREAGQVVRAPSPSP